MLASNFIFSKKKKKQKLIRLKQVKNKKKTKENVKSNLLIPN